MAAAPRFASGAWYYNGAYYPTEAAALAVMRGEATAGDPTADFNQQTFDAIPTSRAPIATTSSARGNEIRALTAQLNDIPYASAASNTTGNAIKARLTELGSDAGASPTGQYEQKEQAPGGVFKNNSTTISRVNPDNSRTVVADFSDAFPYDPTKPGNSVGRTAQLGANSEGNNYQVAFVDPQGQLGGYVGGTRAHGTAGQPGAPGGAPPAQNGTSGLPAIPSAVPTAEQAAANDARQQQDMLIAQLVQQAGRAQSAPPVDSSGYNQSRDQSNATYNALGALSGNNISSMQLGNNAASATQRNDTRGQLMGTASSLTGNAQNNIGFQDADAAQRNQSGNTLASLISQLQGQSRNDVGDIQINSGQYNQGRGVTSDIIQRLIAEAQRPEGPSAAEALMLTGQERALRNAAGDAANTAGGWRSQLVNERRAEGLAAQMASDQAAQSAALRANEETQYRSDVRDALMGAGGLQSDVSGRDLALGTSNAGLLAQIRQGNQTNARESLGLAGTNATAKLQSDTGFATSNADRRADVAKANQLNALNSLLGAGNLQSNALTSDTSFSTSNADRAAANARANQSSALSASQSNQANSLAAQIAAANSAQSRLESDRTLATSNADRLERVNAANAQNSIQALQAAGIISTGIRQGDIQLSQGDQRAVVEMAIAAANIDAQKYGAQLQYAIGMANVEQRKAELQRLYDTDPTTVEKFLGALGPVAQTLGLLGWKPIGK